MKLLRCVPVLLLPALGLQAASGPALVGKATTSVDGRAIFTMAPPTDTFPVGTGTVYLVARNGDISQLWRTHGWYAAEVFLTNDGEFLVRLGGSPDHTTQGAAPLAVAFYRRGRLLKQYTVEDLVRDPKNVAALSSADGWRADRDRSGPVRAPAPALHLEREFHVTTIDGTFYRFDVTTGAIIEARPALPPREGWATPRDIDRLCLATLLVELPAPLAEIDGLLGLPPGTRKPVGPTADEDVQQAELTSPNDPKGHYALRLTLTRQPTPSVTSVALIYVTPEGYRFAYQPSDRITRALPAWRAELREKRRTPYEQSEAVLQEIKGLKD
ncbi:hypothetical protein [Opitutus sp. ER46]|uniref:hypothetical protein n=1 Tax=Opitutus sp. ER46 TaxID=2161864 RepID=UPI000D319B81|nr:hypothetical protein [Opitutus sp. ER46]PTX98633.1 hypothetical protein DB354_05055 [Opitutus sp. ER46]